MNDTDGVAAAKARLIEAFGQIDPLEPVRKHPYISALAAGVAVVMLTTSAERLKGAASLARWVATLFKDAIAVVEHLKPAQPQPSAESAG